MVASYIERARRELLVMLEHREVEVVTRDRPGLLFTLAKTFQDLDLTIGVAKINTEGARVLDVFYVTDLSGRKLDVQVRGEEVRLALLSALGASPCAPASVSSATG